MANKTKIQTDRNLRKNKSRKTFSIPEMTGLRSLQAAFFNLNCYEPEPLFIKGRYLYVCLGNASLKMPENITFQNFIKHWENKFFLSEFSQILGNNPVRSNLVLLFKNSVNSFDSGELLPVKKMKLKNLLK